MQNNSSNLQVKSNWNWSLGDNKIIILKNFWQFLHILLSIQFLSIVSGNSLARIGSQYLTFSFLVQYWVAARKSQVQFRIAFLELQNYLCVPALGSPIGR